LSQHQPSSAHLPRSSQQSPQPLPFAWSEFIAHAQSLSESCRGGGGDGGGGGGGSRSGEVVGSAEPSAHGWDLEGVLSAPDSR